ncbi:MAG: hypothetical protein RIT81_31420 [Deltaproteobacteria bacterium]
MSLLVARWRKRQKVADTLNHGEPFRRPSTLMFGRRSLWLMKEGSTRGLDQVRTGTAAFAFARALNRPLKEPVVLPCRRVAFEEARIGPPLLDALKSDHTVVGKHDTAVQVVGRFKLQAHDSGPPNTR